MLTDEFKKWLFHDVFNLKIKRGNNQETKQCKLLLKLKNLVFCETSEP